MKDSNQPTQLQGLAGRLKYCSKFTQQASYSDHCRPASETPLGWHFAGMLIVAQFYVLTGYQLYLQGCELHFNSPVRIYRKSGVGSGGVDKMFCKRFQQMA